MFKAKLVSLEEKRRKITCYIGLLEKNSANMCLPLGLVYLKVDVTEPSYYLSMATFSR
jgi:hypothetical protein